MTSEYPVKFVRLNLPAMTLYQLFAQPSQDVGSRSINLTPHAVYQRPQNGTFPSKRDKAVQCPKLRENLKKLEQSLKAIYFGNLTSKTKSYEELLNNGRKLTSHSHEVRSSWEKSLQNDWHSCRGMLNKLSDRLRLANCRESINLNTKKEKGPQNQTIEAKVKELPASSNNGRSPPTKKLYKLKNDLTSHRIVRASNFEYCLRLLKRGREATSIKPPATATQVNNIWLECVQNIEQLSASIDMFKEGVVIETL